MISYFILKLVTIVIHVLEQNEIIGRARYSLLTEGTGKMLSSRQAEKLRCFF